MVLRYNHVKVSCKFLEDTWTMEQVDYLLVVENATPGQQAYSLQRRRMLEELGFSTKVLCFLKDGDSKKQRSISFIGSIRHEKIFYHLKTAALYKRELSSSLNHVKPRVIEFFSPNTLILQRNLGNVKTVVSFDLPFGVKSFRGTWLLQILEKKKFGNADLILPWTRFGKNFLIKEYGLESDKIEQIPFALEDGNLGGIKMSDGGFAISYCSKGMMRRKGLDILIKAWNMVGFDKRLIVTGVDMESASNFLGDMSLKIPSNVEFTGMLSHDDYLKTLAASSFFISASRWEDFGIAVLEALSLGKPVVSTPTIGPSELLRDIDENLISPSFSPGDLASSIEYLEELKSVKEMKKRIKKVTQMYGYNRVKSVFNEKVSEMMAR
jgi:glycosyltransferase involved in cell wall biosynthesis